MVCALTKHLDTVKICCFIWSLCWNPKAGYTDANVYIYTEPTQNVEIDEALIGVQRFANKLCMQNGMYML